MKPITSFALLAAIATIGAAGAVATDPVGYLTATVNGNTVNNPAGAATWVAPTLVNPATFTGAASASPSGGTVINFATSGVPALDATYMLEITSGAQEGWWSTVASSTADSITVSDTFPASLPADVQVTVRKFTTVKSWLGNNSPGFTSFSPGVNADQVQILDPLTQAATTLLYATVAGGAPADGWYNASSFANADNTIIYPGTSVKVVRFAVEGLSIVTSGEVKTTATQVDIYPLNNWVSQPIAVGATFGEMAFGTKFVPFTGSNSNYDVIELLSPDQTAVPYAALAPEAGAPFNFGRLSDGTDGTGVLVAEGRGYVVKRNAAQPATIVTVPAPTIAN